MIKKEETLRERMPLARFLEQCLITVSKWSKQYANNDKKFFKTPTINLKNWTEGYQWGKSNKAVTSSNVENSTVYYCPAGNELNTTEK